MQLDFCPHCFNTDCKDFCSRCGFNIAAYETPGTALAPGTIINQKYKIGKVLGIGGFGITYTCCDTNTNIRYALKEYMPSNIAVRELSGMVGIANPREQGAYDSGLKAFIQETNYLIDLKGTPGIVEAYDLVLYNNTAYLVMEYIDGISLKKLLQDRGTLTGEFSLSILCKVGTALGKVHEKGLLHRDISPENIMISGENLNIVTLIDFGASRSYTGERGRDMSRVLKHGYAPPEQYEENGRQGPWTDIYALAATYYKLVTGKTPQNAVSRKQNDTIKRLDKDYFNVETHVGAAIHKALSLESRSRYQNISQFMQALRAKPDGRIFKDDTPDTGKTEPAPTPGPMGKLSQILRGTFSQPYSASGSQNSGSQRRKFTDREPRVPGSRRARVAAVQAKPYVRIVLGAHLAGKWDIIADKEFKVGRDPTCDLVVNSSSISRTHCTVKFDSASQKFIITDYSTNGTYLRDGSRMNIKGDYSFDPGSYVMLASTDYIMEVGLINE